MNLPVGPLKSCESMKKGEPIGALDFPLDWAGGSWSSTIRPVESISQKFEDLNRKEIQLLSSYFILLSGQVSVTKLDSLVVPQGGAEEKQGSFES